ncbi:hypothetical protein [Lacinutrix chionoecetis]
MLQPKMYLITGAVIIILIIGISLLGFENFATSFELLMVPLLVKIYFKFTKTISKRFAVFLILFAIGDFINFLGFNVISTYRFYITTTIYIIAFSFLIAYVLRTISPKKLFLNYSVDLIILLLLNIYLVYVLVNIVKPDDFEQRFLVTTQIMELVYNVILFLLVSLSFINYIQNTTSKYLILFLGCLSLAMAELILIAYYYINPDVKLSYLSTIFYFSGILLILFQSRECSEKALLY